MTSLGNTALVLPSFLLLKDTTMSQGMSEKAMEEVGEFAGKILGGFICFQLCTAAMDFFLPGSGVIARALPAVAAHCGGKVGGILGKQPLSSPINPGYGR